MGRGPYDAEAGKPVSGFMILLEVGEGAVHYKLDPGLKAPPPEFSKQSLIVKQDVTVLSI